MSKFITIVTIIILSAPFLITKVHANYSSVCCDRPILNPECIVLFGEHVSTCVESYCKVVEPKYAGISSCARMVSLVGTGGVDKEIEDVIEVNAFGINLHFDSDRAIVQMLYVGFMSFLGAGALIASGIGLGAAYKRANAETDDQIAGATKSMVNALIGFGIMITSLVVVQIVALLIGAGNLFTIVQVPNILPNF